MLKRLWRRSLCFRCSSLTLLVGCGQSRVLVWLRLDSLGRHWSHPGLRLDNGRVHGHLVERHLIHGIMHHHWLCCGQHTCTVLLIVLDWIQSVRILVWIWWTSTGCIPGLSISLLSHETTALLLLDYLQSLMVLCVHVPLCLALLAALSSFLFGPLLGIGAILAIQIDEACVRYQWIQLLHAFPRHLNIVYLTLLRLLTSNHLRLVVFIAVSLEELVLRCLWILLLLWVILSLEFIIVTIWMVVCWFASRFFPI